MVEVKPQPTDITNIRYERDDKVSFQFKSKTYFIREPSDVILVGSDPEAATRWIIRHYGYLLC